MKFIEGEDVLAKMPNSQEFEKGKVVNVRGNKYRVQFKKGVEYTVNESDMKATRTSRSQSRSRGRPGKSPRKYSPARRSPSRKSPARSPTQSRKLPIRSAKQAKISIPRIDVPKDNSSDTDRTEESDYVRDESVEPVVQSRLRELGPITRRSIRIMSNASKAEHEQKLNMLTRNVDRAVSLPLERKEKYNSLLNSKERGLSVQRDEDLLKMKEFNVDTEPQTQEKSKDVDLVSKPREWGGWIGALLLIIAIPVCTLLVQLACSNKHCSSKRFRIPHYKEWKSFFNLDAFLLYTGFLGFVAIMSALPIGRLVDGQQNKVGRLQYRINGIWTFILTLAAFGGCIYQGYNIGDFLLEKSLELSVVGLAYAIILAIALYIKAGRVPVSNLNIYGSTNNVIYDFWQGREINPRVGPIDIKMLLFRVTTIGTNIINLAALIKIYREYEALSGPTKLNQELNFVAIAAALLHFLYISHYIIFESSLITNFEFTYEGTGYMTTMAHLLYPYLTTVQTRYLLHNKVHQSVYLLIFVFTFFIGYIFFFKSNLQKHEFRKNPFAPSVSHLETIPTKRGTRLIVSGLWGHVRHPNYFGDLLMHWSVAGLSNFTSDIMPYVFTIICTILLIHRAVRDNARCEKRYGFAWEQYCSRVKYMILKRVF